MSIPLEVSASLNIAGLENRIKELESQLDQAVDCINKIHNLYQEDKVFTVYLGEGFYTEEYNDLMLKLICNDDAAIASIQEIGK